MKYLGLGWVALLAVALFLLSSCIELTGQRITMRYDQASDRLMFLLQYDGIHNNKEREQEASERALRDFVANRDVMLFDWFGHFARQKIHHALEEELEPRLREFSEKCMESVEVAILGRYRDPSGRVGAAQIVVFNRASELIELGNAAINEAFASLPDPEKDEWGRRTLPRWRALAEQGHQWLALEGHSLVWRCEIDRSEWMDLKLRFLQEAGESSKAGSDGKPDDLGLRMVATAPLSITESGDEVALRLGYVDRPFTMRCQWRDEYEPNVEETVAEVVPEELDRLLAPCLLSERKPDGHLADYVAWAPAEEKVRAVVAVAKGDDERRTSRAVAWLRELAVRWNSSHGSPPAPGFDEDGGAYVGAWEQWYRDLLAVPKRR